MAPSPHYSYRTSLLSYSGTKLIYIANTLVLGTPLNNTAPDRSGMNKPSHLGSSNTFCTKSVALLPSGNNTDQNEAECQQGTINVPLALVF